MALNTLKCNHLTPLRFKGLTTARECGVVIRSVASVCLSVLFGI